MIFILLTALILLCVWLAYRLGRRDGERKALTIAVYPTPVNVSIDPALIVDVLVAEGWTVSRPTAREPLKPH